MNQNTGATPNLIARTWRGATRLQDRDAYLAYLRETGLDEYRHTAGNHGVIALSRTLDTRAEFLLLSFWESFDAVRNFAGNDFARAVFYPRDDEFLVDRDLTVNHYDLLHLDGLETR